MENSASKSKDQAFVEKITKKYEDKDSHEYVKDIQNELGKIISFDSDKIKLMSFKDKLTNYLKDEKSILIQGDSNSNFPREQEDLLKFLNTQQEKQSKLQNKEKELSDLIVQFHDDLRSFVTNNNYFDKDNLITNELNKDFIKYFQQDILNLFSDMEGASSIINKLVYNKTDVYIGEKSTKEEEGHFLKYRNGFGFYENFSPNQGDEKVKYFGTFVEDEYKKGILKYDFDDRCPYFNGEFSEDGKVFEGIYLIREYEKVDTFFMLLGKLDISNKIFNGIYIKKDEKTTDVFFGDLHDNKKNSKDSIFIHVDESNRELKTEGMKYKIFFGDFENDIPIYSNQNDKPLFVIENSLLYKIHQDKVFVYFNFETEKGIISQGNILNEKLEGTGFISDIKKKIIYEGDFKNGQYEGKGNFMNFSQIENKNEFNRVILIKGDFSSTGILNGNLNYFENKNNKNYLSYVEEAQLSANFDLKYGKIFLEDNESYRGEFKDFQKSGKGIYTYSDGSSYNGDWLNDMKEGDGIYTDKDKKEYERKWKNDEMLRKGTQ